MLISELNCNFVVFSALPEEPTTTTEHVITAPRRKEISVGMIAGIICGVILVLVIIGALVSLCTVDLPTCLDNYNVRLACNTCKL